MPLLSTTEVEKDPQCKKQGFIRLWSIHRQAVWQAKVSKSASKNRWSKKRWQYTVTHKETLELSLGGKDDMATTGRKDMLKYTKQGGDMTQVQHIRARLAITQWENLIGHGGTKQDNELPSQ